jgi:hypothetical protein
MTQSQDLWLSECGNNQATRLNSFALYRSAIGTAWSLLGILWNGQAVLYLVYKLYSVGVSNVTLLGLSTAFPHLVAMQQSYAFRRLIGVITDYCFTLDLTCLSVLYRVSEKSQVPVHV